MFGVVADLGHVAQRIGALDDMALAVILDFACLAQGVIHGDGTAAVVIIVSRVGKNFFLPFASQNYSV